MVRSPCCDEEGLKKGPWTPEEDKKLVEYIQKHGHGSWRALPRHAGLNRCGKSCRLRWTNYLRPDIKRGKFSDDEERLIIHLHSVLGNKWSAIATRLPGRTDNEIKNYWNTHLRKKLVQMGIDPVTHRPRADLRLLANLPALLAAANLGGGLSSSTPWVLDNALRTMQAADAAQFARVQLVQGLVQAITANSAGPPNNVDLGSTLAAAAVQGLLGQPNNNLPLVLQGLLNGAAVGLDQVTTASLSSQFLGNGGPQMARDAQVMSQSWSLPAGGNGLAFGQSEACSLDMFGVEASGAAFSANQTINSGNNTTAPSTPSVASPALRDNLTAPGFQEMLNSEDASVDFSMLSFDYPADDLYWRNMEEQTSFPTRSG